MDNHLSERRFPSVTSHWSSCDKASCSYYSSARIFLDLEAQAYWISSLFLLSILLWTNSLPWCFGFYNIRKNLCHCYSLPYSAPPIEMETLRKDFSWLNQNFFPHLSPSSHLNSTISLRMSYCYLIYQEFR